MADSPSVTWKHVLSDAELLLGELNSRTRSLTKSIKIIREKIASGEEYVLPRKSPSNKRRKNEAPRNRSFNAPANSLQQP